LKCYQLTIEVFGQVAHVLVN